MVGTLEQRQNSMVLLRVGGLLAMIVPSGYGLDHKLGEHGRGTSYGYIVVQAVSEMLQHFFACDHPSYCLHALAAPLGLPTPSHSHSHCPCYISVDVTNNPEQPNPPPWNETAECHKEDVCLRKRLTKTAGKVNFEYDCVKQIDLKGCATVDLTHANLGDAGAATFAAALELSAVIEQAFLPYNEIEEDGAIAIWKVLETHPSLERLFMYNNKYAGKKRQVTTCNLYIQPLTCNNLRPTTHLALCSVTLQVTTATYTYNLRPTTHLALCNVTFPAIE